MASIGLSEAARLAGKNQSTIHRAMQTGRLSYSTDSAGKRVVDTAEIIAAQAETIAQQDATIADLRARLDVEAAERRQLSERLTAVLTDRRETQDGTDPSFAADMGNPITAPSGGAGSGKSVVKCRAVHVLAAGAATLNYHLPGRRRARRPGWRSRARRGGGAGFGEASLIS